MVLIVLIIGVICECGIVVFFNIVVGFNCVSVDRVLWWVVWSVFVFVLFFVMWILIVFIEW